MMKALLIGVLAAAAMGIATPVEAQGTASDRAAPMPSGKPIRTDGLVGTWFAPASGKRSAALLVLGGSGGGLKSAEAIGARFATEGFGVLALAYFGAEGLPPVLQNIPLGYFTTALDWMKRRPLVDPDRIGLYGISIGGETALVVASRHPEIAAVVAAVPSSVVWQGYDPADYRSIESTYVENGVPLPFLPYDTSAAFTGVHDLYVRSLAHRDEHPQAIIPVERIGGAVLLLSAEDDALWPSTEMADQVMARLDAHHFTHVHRHIAYPDAGHGALSPAATGKADAFHQMGGTKTGNAFARADAWARTIAFFKQQIEESR
jgi:dienelactone hydrolase